MSVSRNARYCPECRKTKDKRALALSRRKATVIEVIEKLGEYGISEDILDKLREDFKISNESN